MEQIEKERKTRRIPVNIPVGFYRKDRPYEVTYGEILNISMGGAFIHCRTSIPVGEEVLLEIRFKEATFYEAMVVGYDNDPEMDPPDEDFQKSKIRWSRFSSPPGVGVQFVELAPDKRDYLEKIVKYFESRNKQAFDSSPQ